MNNKRSTKRALTSSILSLVLCMAMLIGTTFAWFTDNASTSVNTIKSGDLEIALEYSEDDGKTWNDAEGKTLNFMAADKRADILWEPGCTYELPLIRVRNNGNLALKYELNINGVTGDAKLLEAIEFTANGNAIRDFSGTLLKSNDTSETILIKGHMKEEATSDYENLTITGVSIVVSATQYTYEVDSYDKFYDEDEEYVAGEDLYIDKEDGSLIATSTTGLISASEKAASDTTVTSVTYVTDEGEVEVPVVNSVEGLNNAAKDKNDIVVVASGNYKAPSVAAGQEITIVGNENTNIDITTCEYPCGNACTINFTGVTVNGTGYTNGLANTKATYTDCIFNTADMYLYAATSFINCTFNDYGTYALWTWGAGTVDFVDCVFNTTGKALYVNANVLDNGTNHQTVNITGCKFYDTGNNDTKKAAIETGDDYYCHSYDIIITDTIVEGFSVTEDKTGTINYGGNNFGTNVWGNKYQMGTDKLNVVIDGVDVY